MRVLAKVVVALMAAVSCYAQTDQKLVVDVTTTATPLSPVSDRMDQKELQERDARTVKDAIDYLPGVTVDHKSPRNQSGISIGGFDSRQVPLYIDGVPAYVPFDGYVDLSRYLAGGISEVQVAKGYSSSLLGPNGLGGVINLVTRRPERRIEGEGFLGSGSGNLLNTGLNAGSRFKHFFLQGSVDRMQSSFYPIAGGDHRLNSYQRDERFDGRAAWLPNTTDSYGFSYFNQMGKSGDPPYTGDAARCPTGNASVTYPCVTPKYWKWPYWNTDGYTFTSNTVLGSLSSVQFRGFYSRYPNRMDMYDDATYSSMKSASSGILKNDDHSIGTSGEFSTRLLSRNAFGASFFLKNDTHREQTNAAPWQKYRDQVSSFGAQDVITITSRLKATAGFSADHLNGLEAQGFPTDHVWSYNPVASLSYAAGESGTLFVTFADKSRFPTLKDRYSFKAGRAIPNPFLQPEHARNWTAGYSRALALNTVAQIDVFRSDVRDEIENIFSLGRQQAVNVGKEIHQGFNITLRSTPVPRLNVNANYTFLNRRITGTPNVFPAGTPRHKVVGTATLRLPRGATGIFSARYQSGAVAMSDNTLPLPVSKFATVDLGALVPIRAGMMLQAGVKNLFDRDYYYWEGFPEAGRNWYFTLRYTF